MSSTFNQHYKEFPYYAEPPEVVEHDDDWLEEANSLIGEPAPVCIIDDYTIEG